MRTDLKNTSNLEQFAWTRFGHMHFTSVLQDGAAYRQEREIGAGSDLETRRLRGDSSLPALGARKWFALERLRRIGSPSEPWFCGPVCVTAQLPWPALLGSTFLLFRGEAGNVLPPLSIT